MENGKRKELRILNSFFAASYRDYKDNRGIEIFAASPITPINPITPTENTKGCPNNGTAFCISGEPEYIVASYFMYSATWSTGTIASLKM